MKRRIMQLLGVFIIMFAFYIILCYIDMLIPLHIYAIFKRGFLFKVLGIFVAITLTDIGFLMILFFR